MASDRARVSFDPSRQWRGVVAQQGRVSLEADWNESATIDAERDRLVTLDVVGSFGSPNGRGYLVAAVPATGGPAALLPGDLIIGEGTLYLGGVRLELDAPIAYSAQPDWLDRSTDPRWVAPAVPTASGTSFELVYLVAAEQEVSAVEDPALADVALGGPDTTQRRRILQRVLRQAANSAVTAENWWTALESAPGYEGLQPDSTSMLMESTARLQVSFPNFSADPDPCQPVTTGGYLGAENQMIRICVCGVEADGPSIVWGFDDASFLYRVVGAKYDSSTDRTTLTLANAPVDTYHYPAAGQVVELLRSATQLSPTDFIASSSGFVSPLAAAYDPTLMTVVLSGEPPDDYLFATASGAVGVAVTTPAGTSPDVPADEFTYGPAVSGISPAAGPAAGGTLVTVTGSGFTGATEVDFGTDPGGSLTVLSDTQLTVSAPPVTASGPVDVIVVAPSGTSPVAGAGLFTYGLAVTGLSPAQGPVAGGTVVTLTGNGFTGATAVTFDGQPATDLVAGSDTQLTVTTPASDTSATVEVAVTTADGTSPPSLARFTYGPVVNAVGPVAGPVGGGTSVTVTGSGFTGATEVAFGSQSVSSPTVLNDTQLSVVTPAAGGSGTVDVSVTTPGGTSPAAPGAQFTYGPAVTGIAPAAGPVAGGTTLTLSGTGFTGATEVTFGVQVGSDLVVVSDTELTVTTPPTPSSGTVAVAVITPAGTSPDTLAGQFTYGPAVTGVSPAGGPVAGETTVTLTGSGFTGATEVTFGVQIANDLVVVSDTELTVTAPVAPAPQQLYLRVWQGQLPAPVGTPTALGDTGIAVTLSSTNGAFHVGDFWHFALRPIQPAIVYPARYLGAPQPPEGPRTWVCPLALLTWKDGAVSGTTLVPPFWSLVELTSAVLTWLAIPPAAVTGIVPAIGPLAGGTQLTITGSGFTGATSVHFGTVAGTGLWVVNDTQLRVTSPPGLGTVDVTVSTQKGTSPIVTADQFAYLEVTGLSPSGGPAIGGTTVTVIGSGFTGATSVQFGTTSVALSAEDVLSDSQVSVTTPPGSGTVDVTVTTPLGTSPSAPADHFSYAPTVNAVSPNSGLSSGGTQVTVTGSGFTGASAVRFGPNIGSGLIVQSDSQLMVFSPAGAGTVDITVTTGAGTSPTSPVDQFVYQKLQKELLKDHKDTKEKELKEKEKEFKEHDKLLPEVKVTDVIRIQTPAPSPEAAAPAPGPAPTGRSFIAPEERPDVGRAVADEEQDTRATRGPAAKTPAAKKQATKKQAAKGRPAKAQATKAQAAKKQATKKQAAQKQASTAQAAKKQPTNKQVNKAPSAKRRPTKKQATKRPRGG